MKILRAFGLLIFLWVIQTMLGDVFSAFSDATVATLNTIEQAATVSESHFENFH